MYGDIDPRNLPVGTVVDGYTVTGRLGGGGMGEIYRVQRGAETFALKLQGERLTDAMDPVKREDLEARSRREAAVLLSLSHPNILDIIGSGRWPDRSGYLYLITELVEGDPLDVWQFKRKPSLRQLVAVFERVAAALDYMHRAGVFHRDIKEGNVLVRDDGSPVVIDLGIARSPAAYTLTRVGTVIGTTTHLSPGICRYIVGDKSRAYRFGPQDDLHALGFMLYERLTGTPPFRVRDDVELPEFEYYHQVIEHVPSAPSILNPAVPEGLSAITLRLLAKTPESGYPGAAPVREELEAALAAAPSSWDVPFVPPRGPARSDFSRGTLARSPRSSEAGGPSGSADVGTPSQAPGNTQAAIDVLVGRAAAPLTDAPGIRVPTPPAPSFRPLEGEEPRASPPQPEKVQGFGETTLRQLGEQLRGEPPRGRRPGALALAFLAALVLVGGALSARSLLQGRRATTKTLLERYREDLAREQAAPREASGTSPEAPSLSSIAPAPPAPATSSAGSPPKPGARLSEEAAMPPALRPDAPGSSEPSRSDERAIRAELEQAYGSKRPTIPSKGHPRPAAMPSWVKGVQVVDAKATATDKKLGGRYGDHLRFQLRSNLDSRLCGSGTVEAVLVRPYLVEGALVLPSRTLAYGQCSAQGGRFLITFSRLRLPEGSEAQFEGLAMDVTDGKPGLLASRRLSGGSLPTPQQSPGGDIARGAASTVLSAATGGAGLAGQVANSAGQTAINTRPEQPAVAEDALLLDASAGIDVFIRQAF